MASKKWKNKVRNSDGLTTREYNIWIGIRRRCREGGSEQLRNKGYVGCTFEKSWEDFDIFCEWIRSKPFWDAKDDNNVWYEVEKDMFSSGVKKYTDETVCFVPNCINTFLVTADKSLGYTYNKRLGKYVAQVSDCLTAQSKTHLGVFDNADMARLVYTEAKRNIAKKLALAYAGRVEQRVTDYLNNYGERGNRESKTN